MTNLHDVDLFPVLDINLFPEIPEHEIKSDAFLMHQPSFEASEVPSANEKPPEEKKAVREKNQSQAERRASGKAAQKKPKQKESSASVKKARVYISDVEESPKKFTPKASLGNELWFWILEIILVLCNAWIIAIVLYILKNKKNLQFQINQQKK